MRRILSLIIALAACVSLFNSCEEDSYAWGPEYKLSYSADTLKFESLLTGQPTPTRTIVIHNNSGRKIMIHEFKLRSESNSFQVIVDGTDYSLKEFFEVADGDSLYVFVRANVSALADNKPLLLQDSLLINYSGNTDCIILSAVARNATVLRNHTIEHDTVWTKDQPFLVYDTLRIAEGAKLTIKAGTEIQFHNNAMMQVDGTLDIQGNASDMVLLSGDRFDRAVGTITYDQLSDQWGGIRFSATSTGNIIEGAQIQSSTTGIVIDSSDIDDSQWRLTLANSIVCTSHYGLVSAYNAKVKAYNTLLANGGLYNVKLDGGEGQFDFCTLTMPDARYRMYGTLYLKGSEQSPLKNTTFNSCIINGTRTNEVTTDGEEGTLDYTISNSIAFSTSEDTVHYTNCKKKTSNHGFKLVNITDKLYDFHIDSLSEARNIGDPTLMKRPELSTDLEGNPRTDIPDAGAYTYIP